jgi:Uma2 family endonuclease
MGIPTLVVEVLSPSTRSRDVLFKMNTYMTSGVKEYWVVDPVDKKVIVYIYENYEMKHMDSYTTGLINSFTFDIEISVEDVFEL